MPSLQDNRTILQKADLVLADLTSGGGKLQPAQAAKFLRIAIKRSELLKMATVSPLKAPKQIVDKMRFGSRILRAGTEAVALSAGDRSKPDLSKVEYDAQLFKGEVRLTNETLEDSIERQELRTTIMQTMAERVGLDMEEVVIQGDVASTDPFLAKFDGVLKAAVSNVVDSLAATTNKTIFRDMMRAMPSEFLRDKASLRFLTSVNSEIGYRDALADRGTVGGDKFLMDAGDIAYTGIPILPIPMFPENIGTSSQCTSMLLLDPKNIGVGVWRQITIETDKLVSEGVLVIVVTLRFDMKYQHEPAVVKSTNVKVVG